ncbi:hypothetical protein TrispH2_003704 [Trichoplax sp. H2]|nr:hypothetical protein TrispH2_003704 [Trichoplax sp. H2]|eukprot:RDD44612.1 hypothetical protein TrispH2_003704 [Trichoplax sp. H2]
MIYFYQAIVIIKLSEDFRTKFCFRRYTYVLKEEKLTGS